VLPSALELKSEPEAGAKFMVENLGKDVVPRNIQFHLLSVQTFILSQLKTP
jgi:hypothetical protein